MKASLGHQNPLTWPCLTPYGLTPESHLQDLCGTEEDLVARILAFGGTVHNTLGIFERLRENMARPAGTCN